MAGNVLVGHRSHYRKPRTRESRSTNVYPFTFGSSSPIVEALSESPSAKLKNSPQISHAPTPQRKSSASPRRLDAQNLHLSTNTSFSLHTIDRSCAHSPALHKHNWHPTPPTMWVSRTQPGFTTNDKVCSQPVTTPHSHSFPLRRLS